MTPEAREALRRTLGDQVAFDVPTARMTSLRVGGPADAVATPADRPALTRLLGVCARHGIRRRVIGRGFNTIVRDEGVDGVLVRLKRFRRLEERPDAHLLAEAGVSHATLTRFCRDRGLGGLEFGAGIPGSLGGWVAMNAGIPGHETGGAVREIEVVSPTGRHRRRLPGRALRFRYRALSGLAPGSIVVGATLRVRLESPEVVGRAIDGLLARRSATQPLDVPSCGSVFKNPPGAHAGALIERAGLKGFQVGGARISPVHANFIENRGGATAADVLALIARARDAVQAQSGIRLETEVRVFGRASS